MADKSKAREFWMRNVHGRTSICSHHTEDALLVREVTEDTAIREQTIMEVLDCLRNSKSSGFVSKGWADHIEAKFLEGNGDE